MSACETGLGHATSEGIYGLQRAFKKAGVRHIVVNVGEAGDVASSLFMTEFYKDLISDGNDIHSAFRTARAAVQKRYPDPYYWPDSCFWTDNLSCLQSNPRIKCQGLRSVEDIHKLFTGDGLFFEEVPRAFVHLVDVGGDDVGGFFLGGGDHLADFGVDVSGSLVRAGQLR